MPKREKTKNIQNEQPTHTPHPHNKIPPEVSTNTPRSFAKTTIAHSKFRMCIDAKFPHALICTPKFRNVPKSEVSDYLKRPYKFPPTQQSTPKFHNALKSKVSGYLKRPSKFPYIHEVRGFGLSNDPTHPNHPPRSHSGFLIASKIPPPFKGKFYTLGSRPTTARATANGR